MKKYLLSVFIFLPSFFTKAATITWDGGGGDGLWSTAANWFGDMVPGTTDDVLLDNLNGVPGSYAVTLPGGTVTTGIISLTITPTGINNITLTVPNTNTGIPGLIITGPGDAVVLNNGAILKNSSGAASGTGISIVNTFRINNGGHYIHNTDRGNAGIVSRLSAVAGTELGEFEFDDPSGSTIVSLSGNTFGTLTLSSAANGGSASYIGSGAFACNVKGNMNIKTGVSFAISMSAAFIISGSYNQATSSTFNLQSATSNNIVTVLGNLSILGTITESSTGLPTLELNGSINQNITATGSIINSVTLKMNNPAGATLGSALSLPYHLILTNGKIATTLTNLLTLADNATYSGGSATSFVEGPMRKVGDDDFIFPVGKGSIYAPVGISGSAGAAVTDQFTAEYVRINPQSLYGRNYEPPIDHISYAEYWRLDRDVGSPSKKVTLTVNYESFAYHMSTLMVSRYDGVSQWKNEGGTIATGPVSNPPCETGTIITPNPVANFNLFTLATSDPFNANPLPVNLVFFNVEKNNNNSSVINWELATNCSGSAKFEVQRSADGRNFSTFGTIPGSETNRFYSVIDSRLPQRIIYYRLRMIDFDGRVSYSGTAVLINDNKSLLITSFTPNPVHIHSAISINSAKKCVVNFIIYDFSGKLVKQWYSNSSQGTNIIYIDVHDLPAGIYQLMASTSDSRSVIRFLKQ